MTGRCKCHQEIFGQVFWKEVIDSWAFSKCLTAKAHEWLKSKANPDNQTVWVNRGLKHAYHIDLCRFSRGISSSRILADRQVEYTQRKLGSLCFWSTSDSKSRKESTAWPKCSGRKSNHAAHRKGQAWHCKVICTILTQTIFPVPVNGSP